MKNSDIDSHRSQNKGSFCDQRNRTWVFVKEFPSEDYCVYLAGHYHANSPARFHFKTEKLAIDFINLIRNSH